MHFGAKLQDGAVEFHLWAPKHLSMQLIYWADGEEHHCDMRRETTGWFSTTVQGMKCGDHYLYALEDGTRVADPASYFQPMGEEGPSEIIEPSRFRWTDTNWRGRPWEETILYEIHVGCFSETGDFDGVSRHLDHLKDLGVTALELMPIHEFTGQRNWGYDELFLYAPCSVYGRPEDLVRLVDACHARGLMIFLDVVFNHFGATEKSLKLCCPDFFHTELGTPWGAALAFDNALLRSYLIGAACSWICHYHVDGLRLDAVHAIESVPGGRRFLRDLSRAVRNVDTERHIHLVLENDGNEAHWLPALPRSPRIVERREHSDYDAQWNDDFHHAAHVLATGESDGYYIDYTNDPFGYLIKAVAEGFAYQGDPSIYRNGQRRGEFSADRDPCAFVNFLQNHDQVGNRAFGERLTLLAAQDTVRALHVVLLLCPQIPLLFMGEEWDAESPFLYFCDVSEPLASAVRDGRQSEFSRFCGYRHATLPDPCAKETYLSSRLNWNDLGLRGHRESLAFTKHLLVQRRQFLVPHLPIAKPGKVESRRQRAGHVVWELADGGQWHVLFGFSGSLEEFERPAGRPVVSFAFERESVTSWASVFLHVNSSRG